MQMPNKPNAPDPYASLEVAEFVTKVLCYIAYVMAIISVLCCLMAGAFMLIATVNCVFMGAILHAVSACCKALLRIGRNIDRAAK